MLVETVVVCGMCSVVVVSIILRSVPSFREQILCWRVELLVDGESLYSHSSVRVSLFFSLSLAAGQYALRGEISTWDYCWHPHSRSLFPSLCLCMTPIPPTFILHAPNLQSTQWMIGKILCECVCMSTEYKVCLSSV